MGWANLPGVLRCPRASNGGGCDSCLSKGTCWGGPKIGLPAGGMALARREEHEQETASSLSSASWSLTPAPKSKPNRMPGGEELG